MRVLIFSMFASLIAAGCTTGTSLVGAGKDQAALQATSEAILSAFAAGDADAVMAYHHPSVAKALGFNTVLADSTAVREDLSATLRQFKLEFVSHHLESLLIHGDIAVEQTVFAIRGTPKAGGEPFLFKGRAMVVYIRYEKSPTGWASIRELIQPAPT
jgi:ketosteroid isomerase-like protein